MAHRITRVSGTSQPSPKPPAPSEIDPVTQIATSALSAPSQVIPAVSFEAASPTYDFNAKLLEAFGFLKDLRMEMARELLGETLAIASSLELKSKDVYVIPECQIGIAFSYPEESDERVEWSHRALESIQELLEKQFAWQSFSEKQNTYRELVQCLNVLRRQLISLDDDKSQRKIVELLVKCGPELKNPAFKLTAPPIKRDEEEPLIPEPYREESTAAPAPPTGEKIPVTRDDIPQDFPLKRTVEPLPEQESHGISALFAFCIAGAVVVGVLAFRHIIQINSSQT